MTTLRSRTDVSLRFPPRGATRAVYRTVCTKPKIEKGVSTTVLTPKVEGVSTTVLTPRSTGPSVPARFRGMQVYTFSTRNKLVAALAALVVLGAGAALM